uniref:Venom peptide Htglin gamma n=1 Tax=Hadogenes troglodytes TaxID=1577150 RepID=A0A1B3IJ27_9SCOR|nr:venom peptide Htglin gamma [Hadogenes troglodytes]
MKIYVLSILFSCAILPSWCLVHHHHGYICRHNLVDRFCGLNDRKTPIECLQESTEHAPRITEIFQSCFKSVKEGVEGFDEQLAEVCKLKRDEYDLHKRCFHNGLVLQHRRDEKSYRVMEECIETAEKKEDKVCHFGGGLSFRFGWYI